MNEKKRHPFLRCLGIIGAFWALVLFGPALVMLINNVNAWFSGYGFLDGSFGYKALMFLSQPIACVIACSTAEQISDKEHSVCVLVNIIVAICISALSALCSFFLNGKPLTGITNVVSFLVLVCYAFRVAKAINTKME
jgi:hypothetical protein